MKTDASPYSSIRVHYRPEMVADSQSFSPSAAKPSAAVESWMRLDVPVEIVPPAAVTVDELSLAHERAYVEDVLAGRRSNGFGNRSADVARSLPYTTGSLVSAARDALERGVAVSPSSGFHHAGYETAGGFCTFNGLVVAAMVLRREHSVRRVGILDCDAHYGDGTDAIIRRLGLDWIDHYTAGAIYHSPAQADEFLEAIPGIVRDMSECDLILYQAGADPHIEDPLGGWLSTRELRERDSRVFAAAQQLGIPVAWNLAGGYQEPLRRVLDIHDNTMRACAHAYLGLRAMAA